MTTPQPLLGNVGTWINPGRALRVPRERAVVYWAELAEVADPIDIAPAFLARSIARYANLSDEARLIVDRDGGRSWARAVCDEAADAAVVVQKFLRAGRISEFLVDAWLPVAPIRELHAIREGVLAVDIISPHAPMTHGLMAVALDSTTPAIRFDDKVEQRLRSRAVAMCSEEGVDDFRDVVRGTARAREIGQPKATPRGLSDEQWMLENHGVNWYVGGH